MKSMIPKYVYGHDINIYGIRIPKGAVIMRLDATGRHSLSYVWVTDVPLARKNKKGFSVHMLSSDDQHPRKIYIDASKGYARKLKSFIDALPEDLIIECRPEIYRRDLNGLLPKEPTGGQYHKPGKGYRRYLQGLLRKK